MLVITNGRVLVDPAMNAEKMGEFIEDLAINFNELYESEIEFKKVTKPFLMYEIPEIEGRNLLDALPPETRIEYMAIGKDDEVTLPNARVQNIKHHYSVEELQNLADKMCDDLEEISQLEQSKKAHAKRLGEEINTISIDLLNQAQMHRQGFQMKDIRVYVNMNFKERMKYYISVADGTLVHSEPMDEKDQRTLFDIKGYDANLESEIEGFKIGIPEDQELDEDKILEDIAIDSQADDKNKPDQNDSGENTGEDAVNMEEV